MGERCVIGGGPGTGKTTIINELSKYPEAWVSRESATVLSQGEVGSDGKKLWDELIKSKMTEKYKEARLKFEEAVFEKDVESFTKAPFREKHCFFDCGIIEVYAYLKLEGIAIPSSLTNALKSYKYDYVFLAPLWPEHFKKASVPQAMEWARNLSKMVENSYKEFGYKPITVPKAPPEERAKFITDKLD